MRIAGALFLMLVFLQKMQAQDPKEHFGVYSDSSNFRIEYRLYSFCFSEDSASGLQVSFSTDFHHLSGIVPFYFSGKRKYGVQFEVFQSEMTEGPEYFIREAYYYMDHDRWIFIYATDPLPVSVTKHADLHSNDPECSIRNFTGFRVEYALNLHRL